MIKFFILLSKSEIHLNGAIMRLDVLAKALVFGVIMFFVTWSAALFKWTNVIKIVAQQYGGTLTNEDVNNMDWSTKVKYFKRNPVTVARQIDHIFNKVFPNILYSGMHPIGQILNHDERREFQHRTGLEHAHIQIHVKDAPKIDENDSENDEIVEFINKYITCSLPDKDDFPDLHGLVNTVQTHHHTTTCRNKNGLTCRFNGSWPPSEKTHIIRGKIIDKNEYKQSKKVLDKVLSEINTRTDLYDVTLQDLLDSCNLSKDQYYAA